MPGLSSLRRRWVATDSALPSIGVVAVVYILTLAGLEGDGLWQVDNANKLLQVQAILHSGGEEFSLPWPGKTYDPAIEYNPIPNLFSRVEDGRLFSVFSPVFALVSTVPYALVGQAGLYILPLLASLIMLVGVGRLANFIAVEAGSPSPAQRHAAILLAGTCTPVWFYSVVFWEHTIAVCLCVWSLYYALSYHRSRIPEALGRAAVLAAMSVYFRDELYIFCLVIAAAIAAVSAPQRVRVGLITLGVSVASLVPLWLFQWHTIGHPFGFHLGSHLLTAAGIFDHMMTRPQLVFNLLLSSTPIPPLSILIAIPFVAATMLSPSKPGYGRSVNRIAAAALVGAAASLTGYYFFGSPLKYMLHSSNSLFTVAPFMVIGLLHGTTRGRDGAGFDCKQYIWMVALGFTAAYALAAPEIGSRGIHWGNRYLLLLYPLCAALAAGTIVRAFDTGSLVRGKTGRGLLIALVVLSFGAQLYSLRLLDQQKQLSVRLNEAIGSRSEKIVVTTVRWAPQILFDSFYDKAFFYADSPAALSKITDRLATAGENRYLLITLPTPETSPPSFVLRDEEFGFFSLAVTPSSL